MLEVYTMKSTECLNLILNHFNDVNLRATLGVMRAAEQVGSLRAGSEER